jgi:conjugal transfer mating pair stabilization protein TraG
MSEKPQGWNWLGTVLLLFSELILPHVTVGIVKKTGRPASRSKYRR